MRDERGSVGGVEAVALSALVFVAGTLLVAGAWGVVDAKGAAATAAREAARAYVEQVDGVGSPSAAAELAAEEAMAATGRDPTRLGLSIEGTSGRCERIVVEVSYPVRLAALPFLRTGAATVTTRARHAELVDPFRSGLAGEADCGG